MSTPAIALPALTAAPRGRLAARSLVTGQFVVVVVLLGLWLLLEKFLGAQSRLAFAVVGAPLLVVSTLVVGVWAAYGIRWRKVAVLLLAVLADVGLISGTTTLERAGDRLFFESRRSRLDAFTRDIVAYGHIHQMSDGLRHFTELNGQLVAAAAADLTTASVASTTQPIEQVLARDGITAQRYEDFRERLRDLGVIQFDAEPGYVAFLYDGMVDSQEGYLRVKAGASPPAMHATLFGAALIRLEPIGDGWYRFATT
jgi:hypothetical protein